MLILELLDLKEFKSWSEIIILIHERNVKTLKLFQLKKLEWKVHIYWKLSFKK